jgi:hypothetical protein
VTQLSFQFQYQYNQTGERVLVPIRLRAGNVVTTPLMPHLDTGSPMNVFRAEIAEILNIAFDETQQVIRIGTAGGTSFLAYGHELTIEVIGSALLFNTAVYFAPWLPGVGPDVGVLGLRDFATMLRIGLVHYERVLYLADYHAL